MSWLKTALAACLVAALLPATGAAETRDFLKLLRKQMVADQLVRYRNLQILADSGDPLASYNLAKRLETLGRPELGGDIAHYYSRAVYGGLDYAVPRLTEILKQNPGLTAPRSKAAEQALQKAAKAGNQRAATALMQFYARGTPFGSNPEEVQRLKTELGKKDPEIALALAMEMSASAKTAADEARIGHYLDVARKSTKLGTRTTAENMLRALQMREASE